MMQKISLMKKAEKILNEKICPSLALHPGGVEVTDLKEGVLHIKLYGSCHCCPAAALTLESAAEDEVRTALPMIRRVELDNGVSDSLISEARYLIRLRRAQ